ncbi:hypothetical protein NECAME_03241 [Necator americanus]|uniref:Uncharacterized protein n=1 Tax=Necator americanus TaxID=51031 RepID=W2T7J8_NECAM|nr:hypothetical protein NECAME_03241 [Necator americanus]ETN77141.1 hypothetical protein NECAME_03241 [Necator americanus]
MSHPKQFFAASTNVSDMRLKLAFPIRRFASASIRCAMGPPAMVPKRYMETFKLALFNDMNAVLTRSGVRNQVMSFARAGKKFTSCNMNCVQRVTSECRRRHNCGLSLPSDNIMIQTLKQCMQISGFHTTGVQQICSCLATAGARQLAPICNRIIISK